jgi:nucleotide-binding universal stress UspA family protein
MKVLLAYDGSESAQRALERTAALFSDGAVTVIGVVPAQPSGPRSAGPVMEGDVEEYGRQLTAAIEKLGGLGVTAQKLEAVGHPADAIVDEAERGGFDLIVVGSRGLHGVARFLLGSVSTRVATHAHCDVLVVR